MYLTKGLVKKLLIWELMNLVNPFFTNVKRILSYAISTSNWCIYHEVYSGPFKKIDVNIQFGSRRQSQRSKDFLKIKFKK